MSSNFGKRTTAFLAFAAFGISQGGWAALLADIRSHSHVSTGQFGLCLSIGFAIAIPVMRVTGMGIDRHSFAVFLGTGSFVYSVILSAIGLSTNGITLALIFVVYFCANSAIDVMINALGIRYERNTGEPVLLYLHATYSAGCLFGVLIAGVLRSSGVEFQTVLVVLSSVFLACMAAVVLLGAFPPTPAENQLDKQEHLTKSLSRVVLLLGPIMTLAFFAEGTLGIWSSYYLRTSLGLTPIIGSLGGAAFYLAMTVGRFAGGRFIGALGAFRILISAGVVMCVGALVSVSSVSTVTVLVGFFLTGIALSEIVPVLFSAAGLAAREHAGNVTSTITSIAYGGFIIGPALIGLFADATSMRNALSLIAVAGSLVCVLTVIARHDGVLDPTPIMKEPSEALGNAPTF